jgi:excinuclease ABC subunit C
MSDQTPELVKKLLKKLPETPGVYKMKNSDNEVIYVGKAKNLKNRVKSYFQNSKDFGIKTQKLVENISDIEWVEVNSETEALLLETNYIKDLRPKYNILMKDDKNFVYLRIAVQNDFPKVEIVRQLQKDGAKYFGPKTSRNALDKSLEFLRKMFPIHTCKLKMTQTEHGVLCEGSEKYPCLEFQMKRCAAPCDNKISKEDYRVFIDKIIDFFKGNYQEVLEEVKKQMMDAASKKNFEKAAQLRDLMQGIETMSTKQIVSGANTLESQDIIGVFHDLGKTHIALFQVRAGKMIHNENFTLQNDGDFSEMIQAFLTEFYTKTQDIPKEILIPQETEEHEALETWFEKELLTKVKILVPQKGKKNELIDLAMNNAKSFAESQRARWEMDKIKQEQAEKEITELINNETIGFPKRMECYDISHYSGEATVASQVVFINGKSAKTEYRHYKLKTLEEGVIDDFSSMEEILERRILEIENILDFENQEALPENVEIRKLKKAEIKKFEIPPSVIPAKAGIPSSANSSEPDGIPDQVRDDNSTEKKKEKLNDFYGLFENEELIAFVEIQKFSAKLRLIKNIQYVSSSSDSVSRTVVTETQKIPAFAGMTNTEQEKVLFQALFQTLQGSDLWIISKEQEQYEALGFKKLKTLEKVWQQKPGLVPEEIAENTKQEEGFALRVRIPKKGNKVQSIPNFILIDGGKGQLSSTMKVFKKHGWNYADSVYTKNKTSIAVCSIAKREEEIFFPEESVSRILAKSSEGSFLLQRLRDEAHRFAITFNRSSRLKQSMKSELDEIPGIGEATKKKLLKTFGSVQGIKNASNKNIQLCVGEKLAKNIKKHFS